MESVAVEALRLEQALRSERERVAKQQFEGGATRTVKSERYDLIPPEAEAALARRFGLGAQRHGEGNWKHGGVEFIKATINHKRAHEVEFLLRGQQEDLDAIIWADAALCWFAANKFEELSLALAELRMGKVTQPAEGGHCAK